jgi:hypothetical protein
MSFSFFINSESRRAEQVLTGRGWYQWERRENREKVWSDECGANTVFTCM